MLCTRPSARRQGAAGMLLRWGLELADQEQLSIYAMVSPMIMSFGAANQLGFKAIDYWTLELAELGKERMNASMWPVKKTFVKREPVKT
jgi:hypothetical protein